jgi:hypothetical protein
MWPQTFSSRKISVLNLGSDRFNPSLSLYASCYLLYTFLVVFVYSLAEGLAEHSARFFITTLIVCTFLLILFFPIYLFYVKNEFYVKMSEVGISFGSDRERLFSRRVRIIKWQDIVAIDKDIFFKTRTFYIRTTSKQKLFNMAAFCPYFYDSDRLLDRVRELAGADHILALTLEKELSRPRPSLKKWWQVTIGAIAITVAIWFIGGNIYAAELEKPIEREIANYVRQHPTTPPNQSAIEFQNLITKLGWSLDVFGNGSEVKVKPSKAEIAEWKAIAPTFNQYRDKYLANSKDTQYTKKDYGKIPDRLVSYLDRHRSDIEAIQNHLATQPVPYYGSDSRWLQNGEVNAGDSPLNPKSMHILSSLYAIDLMTIDIIDKHQSSNIDISKDLVAIERLEQSLQSQQTVYEQLIARLGEGKISKLARLIDTIPSTWGNNLFATSRQREMRQSIDGRAAFMLRALNNRESYLQWLKEENKLIRFVPGYYQIASPQIRLEAIDYYHLLNEQSSFTSKYNICQIDRNNKLPFRPYRVINDVIPPQASDAWRYSQLPRQDLSWESTSSIRQIRDRLKAGQKPERVAKEFSLSSQVCPGENWTATATDDKIEVVFSHPPDWEALGVNSRDAEPTKYEIKLADVRSTAVMK